MLAHKRLIDEGTRISRPTIVGICRCSLVLRRIRTFLRLLLVPCQVLEGKYHERGSIFGRRLGSLTLSLPHTAASLKFPRCWPWPMFQLRSNAHQVLSGGCRDIFGEHSEIMR